MPLIPTTCAYSNGIFGLGFKTECGKCSIGGVPLQERIGVIDIYNPVRFLTELSMFPCQFYGVGTYLRSGQILNTRAFSGSGEGCQRIVACAVAAIVGYIEVIVGSILQPSQGFLSCSTHHLCGYYATEICDLGCAEDVLEVVVLGIIVTVFPSNVSCVLGGEGCSDIDRCHTVGGGGELQVSPLAHTVIMVIRITNRLYIHIIGSVLCQTSKRLFGSVCYSVLRCNSIKFCHLFSAVVQLIATHIVARAGDPTDGSTLGGNILFVEVGNSGTSIVCFAKLECNLRQVSYCCTYCCQVTGSCRITHIFYFSIDTFRRS